jgi:cytochrome c peroxidase
LQLPETPYHYNPELPAFYNTNQIRRLDNTPGDNPITDDGATLGRVLFYDTRLSANNSVSCASCHQQSHAFSDPRRFSIGFAGQTTDRHAMALVDLRYYGRGRFFWDERSATLEEQVLMPVQNKKEMGQTIPGLMNVLSADADYARLYQNAFSDQKVTPARTASALSQFVRSLVSYRSKYDQGLAGANAIDAQFLNFTEQENRGKAVFLNRCGNCHLPPNQGVIFSAQATQNNGVDGNEKVADLGVADVTLNRFHAGLFKSPSLRNIEYTGPYMHDGRFATLQEVIEHYSSGVKDHPNLDPRLGGPPGRLRMSPDQKASLLAFLKTLSDPEFIRDPKFSDPFQSQYSPIARPSPMRQAQNSKPVNGAIQ